MKNGITWYDTQGNALHAHGGCIMKFGAYYYWYGEDRRGQNYVSCYRSQDLKNWEFRNHILTVASSIVPLAHTQNAVLKRGFWNKKVNIERPKVVFCEETGKYILWAHYENGRNYLEAAACVASCDTPDGDYTYHGAFRPFGNMSRDCTLTQDGGRTYFISAANENRDLKVYRLTEDCLNTEETVATLWPGQSREAPALFRKDGEYYMLSSACTGWTPNQGTFARSNALTGDWSALKEFGDGTTYHSQPTWVLEKDGKYLYIGDRWEGGGKKYFKSTYVFLELEFEGKDVGIHYSEEAFLTN